MTSTRLRTHKLSSIPAYTLSILVSRRDADEELYSNPAHWFDEDYEEEGDAYHAEEPGEAEWSEFSTYMADEWSRKWDAEDPENMLSLNASHVSLTFLVQNALKIQLLAPTSSRTVQPLFWQTARARREKAKAKESILFVPLTSR